MPLGTGTQPVCARRQGRGVKDASPCSHSPLMRNFMGAEWRILAGSVPEPSARRTRSCRAALTSHGKQFAGADVVPFLLSGPPMLCVCPPPTAGSAPLQVPSTLIPSWGQNQDESNGTLQRPGKLTAGVTPPKMGLLWELSDAEDPWSFPSLQTPQPLEPAAIPGWC